MWSFARLRPKASQAVLFAPALLLLGLGLLAARNGCSRPALRAWDSPDGCREAVVFLEYPHAYPFTGPVQAFLEVRELPAHRPIAARELGAHRWASEAEQAYRRAEWPDQDRLVLWSADGATAFTVYLRTAGSGAEPPRPAGGRK